MITNVARRGAALIATIGLVASLFLTTSGTVAALGSGFTWSHRDANVCAAPAVGQASCASVARTLLQDGRTFLASTLASLRSAAKSAASVSYTAVGIRTAYGITTNGDPSRVIAIVDAQDNPSAFTNIATYRTQMGLPAMNTCTVSQLTALTSSSPTPCFAKVNQSGAASPLPAADAGWSNEIDLDLQASSAICPNCSILLLEATSSSFGNLGTAVTTASNTAHVVAISNSYGTKAVDYSASQWDAAAAKGIAVFASTGDWGYGISFPASSTKVIGVGGTNLQVSQSTGVRTSETVWSSGGSGCSTLNAAPSWQIIAGSPCGTKKAVADLSADADPNSGLQIYTTYSNQTGWWIFGGTSLSSPIMAAYYAMQAGYGGSTLAGQYAWSGTPAYFDVTSGSNGSCSKPVVCNAGVGWDGPTGLGSIQVGSVAATSPGAPTLNSATAGNSLVNLSWTAPVNNGGANVTGYAVYRSTTPGGEGGSPYWSLGNVTTWSDTNVTNGTTYYYKVAATNSVGTGGQSGEKSAMPTAGPSVPGAPTLNSATAGAGQVTLSWSAPGNNGGASITHYNVYRGISPGGETRLTQLGNVTSYTNTGLTAGTTYYYKVSAVNSVGEGALSGEKSATPTAANLPGAPTNLTAKTAAASNKGAVRLNWTAASNGGSAITAYNIYRSTTSGAEVKITSVGKSAVTYLDNTGTSGQLYFYEVTAVNKNGEGPVSNEASAKAR